MAWIKRNLLFVVGLVVALLLVAGGVFFLLSSMSGAADASANLDAANQQYDKLLTREPFPNKANIDAVKSEQARVRAFQDACRRYFAATALPDNLDDESFKALLESTTYSLDKEADRRGVKLPAGVGGGTAPKYAFTFSRQKGLLKFPTESLKPFSMQLMDLDGICRILFDSRIHSLVSLKRTAVGTNDPAGSTDVIPSKKVGTNAVVGASLYPYEVAFQCFSSELASVLNNFAAASNTYAIKTINVERGQLETPATAAPVMMPQAGGPMIRDAALAARYGIGRPTINPTPVAPAATSGRPGEILLDEKPLKVTIGLEVVRLNPVAAASGGGRTKPPGRTNQ
ncbi:MAG TPA: Amuc_1100 family pilus-like protein [Candidatus Limnocylindria bacterium]|jgi:hypothetical protein|nr:Amuc_1100 family pilus-like protein [Candidatus Limnocylindria bacterium]